MNTVFGTVQKEVQSSVFAVNFAGKGIRVSFFKQFHTETDTGLLVN